MVKVREQLLHIEGRRGNMKEGHFLPGDFAKHNIKLSIVIKINMVNS